jgi:outer membrane protein OmpA-like peptidoglycan-associated protein
MNRTALGIIDAYFRLYPKATFADLKQAFPDSLNPTAPRQAPKSIFKPYTDRDFGVVHSLQEIESEFSKAGLPFEGLFFMDGSEKFKTSDGVTVVVNKLWESLDAESKASDLELLANQAKKYGIVVNKFEARAPFARGSYSIDVIQPALFDKISGNVKTKEKEVVIEKTLEKKVIPVWIWILIALLLLPLILWLLGFFKSEPQVVEKEKVVVRIDTVTTEKIVKVIDTVFVQEIAELETKFNSVQYKVGKFDIPDDTKYALHDLANILKKHPEVRLKVEGHTSREGDMTFNKSLSEKRARTVVDFLISQGADSTKLSFEGLGSRMPIDNENLDKNRRTEFVIINDK